MEYSEFVEQSANEHELDKFLIYAIIKTESGFNHEAVSELGARGLMQIMPDAFEWIKNYRLFEDDITYDDMFNPQDNIRYGTYFISHNMERYEGNINNSLAAYHAGISAVDGWLLNKEYSSDGKTLHTIPISQTSHYVNKVNKAYEMYLELYEK
jgi:soluble lytic murein transglycosylase